MSDTTTKTTISSATPTLATARLWLRPFAEELIGERYLGWLNDPELMRYSENRHRRHTLESCRGYLRSFDGSGNCFWALFDRSTDAHIGNMNAYVDEPNRVADMGILIGERAFHRRGLASEAFASVCRYLLDQRGMRKVTAGAMAANAGMLAVMRQAGMIDDGVRRGQLLLDGQPVDVVHAALWANGRQPEDAAS